MRLLRKLVRLSPREWGELVQAQFALVAAQVLVWTRPTGRLVSSTGHWSGRGAPLPHPTAMSRAQQLGLAVSRAGDYGVFRPLCLVRAVALNRLLERHRIHGSRIRIGVRMRNGRFGAHAWVEFDGNVVGDSTAHVASFAELADVQLVDAP